MNPINLFRALVCSLLIFFFFRSATYAQCADSVPARVISYDTLLYGGGNDLFSFNFPQFDPTLGTLIKVDVETVITVKYSYDLENKDAIPISYKVRVIRTDDIVCSGLLTPLTNTVPKIVNTHILSASDGNTGSGTDYVNRGPEYPLNGFPKTHSITGDVAGFLGIGSVTFDYTSTTDSYASGSINNSFNTSATDSISFTLKYYYCATTFLPADIRNFTAVKRSEENIQLNWFDPTDEAGKKYDIQKSTDGRSFYGFGSIASLSNTGTPYQINYTPTKEDKSRIFFRIRETQQNGVVKYSAVRNVTLLIEGQQMMKVYPTITANMVNIFFPGKARNDWQVNLISLSGQVVQQAQFSKTNFIKWPIKDQVAEGFYIIEAINKKTSESQQSKIIVQR